MGVYVARTRLTPHHLDSENNSHVECGHIEATEYWGH